MTGERNLQALLKNMKPVLLEQDYVFVSFPQGTYADGAHLQPVGMFAEAEGLSLIIPKKKAHQYNLAFDGVFRCISLQVHSSLEAVGLTAAISRTLAEHDISANVVAAFYHDHVFVPVSDADKALSLLSFS